MFCTRTRKTKIKVQTSAGKVMASGLWDSEGTLLVELLKRGCHNQFRAICADIKEVENIEFEGLGQTGR
jgi:hypothetical protein